MSTKPQNIVFFHPDLGIGGAERLVIDAAVGLQNRGHKVTIFTSYCDPQHCFDEARDGTLDVRVRGNSLCPSSILGRFSILCAIIRQIHLILQICAFSSELRNLNPTAFIVDQLSAGIPLLRVLCPNPMVLFYCHFPDKLLAKKEGLLKSVYRRPFDWLESWSTGCSDGIVVNSKFTKGIFHEAFPQLNHRDPKVVYPCVDINGGKLTEQEFNKMWEEKILLSINRFERKKDVGLAIRAYAGLSAKDRENTRLVVAGGYDPRVSENVSYHSELQTLAESLGLAHATAKALPSALAIPSDIPVLFLLSVPNTLKSALLTSASLLVYTPRNEHFGIVPLEAMLACVPVLAANEGGPLETVVEGETGWLRDGSDPAEWTAVMSKVLNGTLSERELRDMGENGRKRVTSMFTKEKMAANFENEIVGLANMRQRPPVVDPIVWMLLIALVPGLGALVYKMLVR